MNRTALRVSIGVLLAVASAQASQSGGITAPWQNWLWHLPLFSLFAPATVEVPVVAAAPEVPSCLVLPLDPISDPAALNFEHGVESGTVVDVDGLTPATQAALARFERAVEHAGGSFTVTSAHRPAAYQEHLQRVWDKWMLELRLNTDPGCQTLRNEVEAEFVRHSLLESQRPASFSDHTLGIAFDAAVFLPASRVRRKRLTVDRVARIAGLRRPVAKADPVHFRLIGGA